MFSGNNAWFLGGAPPDWSNWPARAGSAQKLRLVSGRGLRMVSAGGRHTLRPVRIQISRAPCDCFYIIKGPERERPKIKQNSKDFFNDDGIDRSIPMPCLDDASLLRSGPANDAAFKPQLRE